MAQPLVHSNQYPSKTVRRKRLQHHIRQIKHIVAKRIPPASSEQKLGTLETLERTVELLKGTPVYSSDGANVSPAHSWSDTPIDSTTNCNEDCWAPPADFADRHIFSVKISLPDGNIVDYRNNSENISCNFVDLEVGQCFFEILTEHGKQALLTNAFTKAERKRILTRISGKTRQACELLCEYKRSAGTLPILQIHVLELRSAFRPSRTIRPLTFCTRHSGSCILTYFDPAASTYIGHLPEDVSKQSILYLIHPSDAAYMKQIHAELVLQRGGIVRQERLRWITHNGSIVHSVSEWSAFWNPWSRKLDVIVGRHMVTENPVGNADVLCEYSDQRIATPLNEFGVKALETEICALVYKYATASLRQDKYRNAPLAHQKTESMVENLAGKHLGTYIDNLVETLVINAGNQATKCSTPTPENLELIPSPTDLSTTNNSNSLLLSYSQINCLENVHRLLKSQPRTEPSSGTSTPTKDSPALDSGSPLPIPEEENINRKQTDGAIAMPLTRELLQQHTQRWEQEYRDTWRRRLSLKRCMQQQNCNSSPLSAKLFRDCQQGPVPSHNMKPAGKKRNDYWNATSKEEYYRSLGPNPPPPPGRNFQITSVPLPPSLPVEERRSAFVSVPSTSGQLKTKSLRELPQPINLCITDPATGPPPINLALFSGSQQTESLLSQSALGQHTQAEPLVIPAIGNVGQNFADWRSSVLYYERPDNCAARLISLAQRAQQQQQVEQRRTFSPLSKSPVKEATDALMLLQDTV